MKKILSKRMLGMDQGLADISKSSIGNLNTGGSTSGVFNISPTLNNNVNTNSPNHTPPTMAARKQLSPSATDSNEPAKPLSPYTLFFRDTVSAIKQQNPNCAFGDLQRIVSSMWEALDTIQKENYNKKAEAARNEYLKQIRIYRVQQSQNDDVQSGQSTLTVNNDASPNVNNLNSHNHFVQGHQTQNPITVTFSENQTTTTTSTTSHMTPSSTFVDTTTNSSTVVNTQETSLKPTPVVQESSTMELCIRDGCNKRAIMNPDWEDEYCSNECVVVHCRNVFNDWVQQNKEGASIQQ